MGNLGATEIILILLAVIFLFGAKKIPEIAKGLGNGIKEFKKATKDAEKEIDTEDASKSGSEKKP
jgi:sec-independent protein translocase protein TatA